jgi:hypothetical protein
MQWGCVVLLRLFPLQLVFCLVFLVPPHDAGIAKAISTALEPWKKYDFSDPAQTKVVEVRK